MQQQTIISPEDKIQDHEKSNVLLSEQNQIVTSTKGKKMKWKDYAILSGTFILMIAAVLFLIEFHPFFEKLHNERIKTLGGNIFMGVSIGLLVFQLLFLSYIIYLYTKYKPIHSVADHLLPKTTIIVPAYNEGKLVYDTLISLAKSNYPLEKMEIISIDDGSKDDTWKWMLEAKKVVGNRLSIFQQPKNMGKRHALYRAFKMGKGDVYVTVDSDSIVTENTLRNLVSPFITNENCGAVGGNVRVLNNKNGMIPRMLNVSFVFSFEFIRSAQSALGSVLCTPGALAAYRKEAVHHCIEDWMNQTFMGNPSDIGEDRAMTNMILKQGYHVLFQRNAYVYTNTPERYKNLYKMFIRWERSNVRENIMMSKFAFTKFRKESTFGPRVLLINQWIKVIMAYPLTLVMLYFVFAHPLLFLTSTLAGIFIFSSIQVYFYSKRYNLVESFWAYPYSLFYTFTLFWITPYAIVTASKRGWLTREIATS